MRLVLSLVCVVRSEVPARPRHRPLGSRIRCPSPLSLTFPIFVKIFGPTTWLVNRLESIVSRPKDPSSDIVFADLGICLALTFSLEIYLVCASFGLSVPSTHVRRRTFGIRRSGGTEPKRARQADRSLVNRVQSLPTPTNHPYRDGMLITCGRIITYVLFADTRRRHSRQMR